MSGNSSHIGGLILSLVLIYVPGCARKSGGGLVEGVTLQCPAKEHMARLAAGHKHDCIRKLAQKRPSEINRVFPCCGTPLMSAALYGNLPTVQLLVSLGANINSRDREGATVLHYAVQSKNMALVAYLLKRGVDCNVQDKDGATALHRAAYHDTPRIAALLVKRGGDLTLRHRIYGTPFMHALDYGHVAVARVYLAHTKLEMRSEDGTRIMFLVARSSNISLLPEMLKRGGNINATGNDGATPLHGAARHERPETIEQLIGYGANPSVKEKHGDTPLHIACLFRRHKNARMLINKSAALDAQNREGETPLHIAVLVGTTTATHMYGASKLGIKPSIHYEKSPPKIVSLLLRSGAKVSLRNKKGETPLHMAARRSECTIATLLLQKGADPDLQDHTKTTPRRLLKRSRCTNLKIPPKS